MKRKRNEKRLLFEETFVLLSNHAVTGDESHESALVVGKMGRRLRARGCLPLTAPELCATL